MGLVLVSITFWFSLRIFKSHFCITLFIFLYWLIIDYTLFMTEYLGFTKVVHYFGNLGTFGFQFLYGDLVWVRKLVTITFSRANFLKLAL